MLHCTACGFDSLYLLSPVWIFSLSFLFYCVMLIFLYCCLMEADDGCLGVMITSYLMMDCGLEKMMGDYAGSWLSGYFGEFVVE